VYSTFPDNAVKSAWRKAMEKGAEHFVELAGMTELQALQRIRQDQVHVLVDMDGYSNEGQRLPSIFVSRLAPIQVKPLYPCALSGFVGVSRAETVAERELYVLPLDSWTLGYLTVGGRHRFRLCALCRLGGLRTTETQRSMVQCERG
jgi:hypothetical protein